jgi:hypothetical protein
MARGVAAIDDRNAHPPDARYMFTGETLGPCESGPARIEAAIYDLQGGAIVASARDESRVIGQYHWSPDGSELLYAAMPIVGEPGPCTTGISEQARWGVLHADGSAPETGVDPEAVMDRWYGDRLIRYSCGDGEAASALNNCAFVMATYRDQWIATTWSFQVLGWLE